MTPVTLIHQLAKEARADMRKDKIHTRDARMSYSLGYWKVAVDRRPELAPHKPDFIRLAVEGA